MKTRLLYLAAAATFATAGSLNIARAQGVGIGTATPDAAAALDVKSTNQGFLPPRLTQSQRGLIPVSSQSAGLLVYQTDGTVGYYYYTGSSWIQLGAQGPQGPQGLQGQQGPVGPQGPQGPAGSLARIGDGSGGALSVAVGTTLDLTTPAGYNALGGRQHLQFTNLNIAGSLIVPSGTTFRATGDVSVTGTITVATGARDNGTGPPNPGVSLAAPGNMTGGIGISPLGASSLTQAVPAAGGSGERGTNMPAGGEGGGSLAIIAGGNVSILSGGNILAIGNSGGSISSGTTDIGGGGGGAGGLVVIAAKGTITVAGAIRVNGGQGANAYNPTTTAAVGAGGGGGGGGGIIHLIASSSPSITGTIQANGGAAGVDSFVSGVNTSNTLGGGGGACGGNGGNGGGGAFNVAPTAATAGTAGYTLTTVVPAPENIVN